ncbi:MAG: hypothetical protein QM579_03965 [Desulfovibrio sp.]|uniref:hypothetical protein n=1 Tax=Desulfovibrio sp. TaxID=885 RepID=UPI0039E3D616
MSFMDSRFQNMDFGLFRAIHTAIADSFHDTSLSEPNMVAKFMCEVVRRVNSIQPLNVRAGGVFVHASPLVSCGDFPRETPASVELGDLLLIRSELINGERTKQAALLLQAKKTDRLPCAPDNENQYHLYSNWPTFTYTRVGRHGQNQGQNPLVGKRRTIRCNNISHGTKYLLINNSDTRVGNFSCCTNYYCYFLPYACDIAATAIASTDDLSHYECFTHELARFILGFGGKPFTLPPAPRSRNWDRVMEDLLTNVANLTSNFTGRADQEANRARGRGVTIFTDNLDARSCLISRGVLCESSNDGPPRNDEHFRDDGDPNGIAVLEFVVSNNEERQLE